MNKILRMKKKDKNILSSNIIDLLLYFFSYLFNLHFSNWFFLAKLFFITIWVFFLFIFLFLEQIKLLDLSFFASKLVINILLLFIINSLSLICLSLFLLSFFAWFFCVEKSLIISNIY